MNRLLSLFIFFLVLFPAPLCSDPYQKEQDLNRELLTTFMSTFLQANDLDNALDIARKGVKLYPKESFWWEWYKKIALWLGKTEEACLAQLKLAELQKSKDSIKEAFSLAISAKRFDIAINLISNYPWLNKELKKEDLLYIYSEAGKINDFINLMENLYRKEKKADYLYYLARAYFMDGRYGEAAEYMNRLEKSKRLNLEETMFYSDILFLNNKVLESYLILKKYFDKFDLSKEIPPKLYCKKLSYLAWILKDLETAARSAELLDSMGEAEEDDYVRIYAYHFSMKDYKKAVDYVSKGYRKSNSEYLFTLWVEGLIALKDFNKAEQLFTLIDRNDLLSSPYLLGVYSRTLYKMKKAEEARKALLEALKIKFSVKTLSVALHMAVGFSDKVLAGILKKDYGNYEKILPREFTLLYLMMQDSQRATVLISTLREKDRDDLLVYAQAIDMLGRTEEARSVRFKVLRELYNDVELFEDKEKLRLFLISGIGMLPSSELSKGMKIGNRLLQEELWLDIYLTHLLAEGHYEKIERMEKFEKIELKPWMELSLALRNNDREYIRKLLEDKEEILPYRDVTESYRRLGYPRKAMEHAYKSMEKNPEDTLLYEQLRQLFHDYGDYAQINAGYKILDKTGYFTLNPSLRFSYGEEWHVIYGGEEGLLTFLKNPNYRNFPSNYHYHKFSLRKYTDEGYYQGGVILGDSLRSFFGLELDLSKRVYKIDNASLSLYYNRQAQETLFTYIGGLKDGLSLGLYESLGPRMGLGSTLEYDIFKSQDVKTIGSGFSTYSEIFYKLRFAYPDYTLRLYTSFGVYSEKEGSKGVLGKLTSFEDFKILPEDSFTIGTGFNFGTGVKEMISRTLSPFFTLDFYYNTVSNFCYGFSLGISGKLMGKDRLSIGLKRLSNFQITGGSYWEAYVEYRLFYLH